MSEKFRNNALKNCGLCSSHYLISLGLSWDEMLKMTKIELELIPDPDMYICFEKGSRGGTSYVSKKYSKAKNKNSKYYDPKQKSKHIIYLDRNNLCCYAMPKLFPTSGLKWIDPKGFDLNKYTSNSSKAFVLEVDLEYLERKMWFEYQLKIVDLYNFPIGNNKKKCLIFLIKKTF